MCIEHLTGKPAINNSCRLAFPRNWLLFTTHDIITKAGYITTIKPKKIPYSAYTCTCTHVHVCGEANILRILPQLGHGNEHTNHLIPTNNYYEIPTVVTRLRVYKSLVAVTIAT